MPLNPNTWLAQISSRLNTTWRGHWKAGTTEPGRYLYDHELVVVTKGSCRVQVETAVHELTAGTFLIISPGTYHVTVTGPGGVHRKCFHFDWVQSARVRKKLRLWTYHPHKIRSSDIRRAPSFVPREFGPGHFDLAGPVPSLMETIFHRVQTGSEYDRATCSVILTEVLMSLLWQKSPGRRPTDRATHLAYTVKELLDSTLSGSIAIQPLLASLGFSYEHLCRLFKTKFGVSPLRYQNIARLERAQNFLHDPKRTIAEAAYAAGFNDPAYFSRKFRDRHGMSPSQSRDL